MPSITVLLSLLAVAAYAFLCYLNGRLLAGLVTKSPEAVSLVCSPLLGGTALGIELWLYGLVGIPWNPVTLVAPWVAAWALARRRLPEAVRADWAMLRAVLEGIRHEDRLALVLAAVTGLLVITYVLNLVTQPLTGFDAISIWFFKAKFFYFTHSVDPGSIPGLGTHFPTDTGPFRVTAGLIRSLDYPPLFPLMVGSLYAMTGGVHDTLGKGVDVIFVLVGAAVVWAALSPYLGRGKAAIFAFLVTAVAAVQSGLGNPIYAGYVDYPLGITMLASLANLQRALVGGRRDTWVFAIVFAAVAALLKSEGLPFLLAVALVAAFKARRVLVSPAAVLAVVLVVAWQAFATIHGWRSHHLLNDGIGALPSLLPARGVLIIAYAVKVTIERPDYLWLAAAFVLTVCLAYRQARRTAGAVLLVVALQCAAYFAVLVLNPGELVGTFDRLIIQLAPAVVLLLGLAISSQPDEEPSVPSALRVKLVGQ